jgi:hypothetical protein
VQIQPLSQVYYHLRVQLGWGEWEVERIGAMSLQSPCLKHHWMHMSASLVRETCASRCLR